MSCVIIDDFKVCKILQNEKMIYLILLMLFCFSECIESERKQQEERL